MLLGSNGTGSRKKLIPHIGNLQTEPDTSGGMYVGRLNSNHPQKLVLDATEHYLPLTWFENSEGQVFLRSARTKI